MRKNNLKKNKRMTQKHGNFKKTKIAELLLKDGTKMEGESFGAEKSAMGEVVFATGMVGYPEALTDPSFRGQILVFTHPLIGNYGIPKKEILESDNIQITGLVVSNYIETPSHHSLEISLGEWLKKENVPALVIKDTRILAEKIREKGVMQGAIQIVKNFGSGKNKQKLRDKIKFEDPNKRNLVAEVSSKKIEFFENEKRAIWNYDSKLGSQKRPIIYNKGDIYKKEKNTVVLIDCGAKKNILRRLLARNLRVAVVPWDTDVTSLPFKYSAVVISNGPGDPTKVKKTIENVKKIMKKEVPILGICLGNQILALASGGSTYKLKFGHRSQNQPCVKDGTKKCYLTTQNHGFAVKKIPNGFKQWFYNANDKTNEGIIHTKLPFMSVQFHPESSPGPLDTDWIFDYFLIRAGILNKEKILKL